jgi:hypothetical protein
VNHFQALGKSLEMLADFWVILKRSSQLGAPLEKRRPAIAMLAIRKMLPK